MLTRQQVKNKCIEKAYSGDYWHIIKNHVDSNGYICYGDLTNESLNIKDSDIEFTELSEDIDLEYWILKSLKKDLQIIEREAINNLHY